MEGNKLSKRSKTLKKSLNVPEINANVSENGKVSKKSAAKKKAKLSVALNSDRNVNKKAAKLIDMIQGPGSTENVKFFHKKQTGKAPGTINIPTEREDSVDLLTAQPSEVNRKNKKTAKIVPKTGNSDNIVVQQVDINLKTETGISPADLKKIEKKKAKKAAQKLKKAQRKSMRSLEANEEPKAPADKLKETSKKASNKAQNGDSNKEARVAKTEKGHPALVTAIKDVSAPVSERVLSKKQRKDKKRQLLKEQKLAEKSTRSPAEEEATVFVGNVPVNTKRVQLIRLFQKYGPVNSIRLRSAGGKVLHKHKMRKAAGSLNAYVVLQSKTCAEKAIELNGTEFKGIHLRVTKSAKKSTAQADNDEAKRTIFVGNLKYSATEEALREIFSSCGAIEYIRCLRDGEKGCKGVAYVCFKHADGVGLALELKDTILDERPIHIEHYSVKKLGAKEQRDAQAAKDTKAKQNTAKSGPKISNKSKNNKVSNEGEVSKKSKKSEFRGVKVDTLKKKNKTKKPKKSQALELAKRIAPKVKN